MAILTSCILTFIDLNEIHIGIMPTNPVNNQIWFDTTSNVLKKYNSSKAIWEIVNDYTDDILDALKGLQVSSRNLLASTSSESQIVCSGSTNKTGGQYYFVGTINYINNIKDKEITLAFDWEIVTTGTPSGTFRAQTTGVSQIQIGNTITLSNSNYYGTCVFTTTLTTASSITGINFRTDGVTGTFKITHPRLFYGSKDLGWSQAPEDIDGKFETIIDKQEQGIYISVADTGNNTKTLVDFNSQKLLVSSSNIDLQGYVTISSLSDPSSTTTIDGNLIETDTLSANKVKTGKLQGKNSSSYFNLDNGTFSLANATQSLMTFDGTSLTFQNNVNYNLDKDDFSSNLGWIKNWTEGSTTINSKQVLSPMAFFGTINASKQATGISLGGALNKIYETEGIYNNIDEGLAGYKAGVKTFHFKSDGTLLIGPNTTGNYISWDGSNLNVRASSINIGVESVATNNGVNTAISNIQVGGRNLAQNTSNNYSNLYSNFSGATNVCPFLSKVLTDGLSVNDIVTIKLIYKYTDIVAATGQIAQCCIQGSGNVTNWSSGSFNGSARKNLSGSGEHIFTYSFTVTADHILNDYWNTNIRHDYVQSGSVQWKMFKVEKGNKATDWTPAPEDINSSINAVSTSLGTLDSSIKSAFGDSIINDSEAKAIASNIQILNNEKSDIDREYATIYNNTNLTSTAQTNLYNAKIAYDSAHSSLISSINTVTADKIITTDEKISVESFFATYRTKIADYKQRLQEALDYISSKKVDNIEVGGKNYALISGDEQFINSYYKTYELSDSKSNMNNKYITVSFYAKKEAGSPAVNMYTYFRNTNSLDPSSNKIGDITTEYKRYVTIIEPSESPSNATHISIHTSIVSPKVYIKNVKVEIGNKATDWSTAPEDTEKVITSLTTRVSTAENQITEDAITNTVKKSFYTKQETEDTITTKGYQTSSQVQQTVDNFKLKFSQSGGYNLIKNSTGASGNTNGWTHSGTSLGVSSNDSIGSSCKTFMYLDNGTTTSEKFAYSSRFKLKPNTKYTLTGYYYNYTTCPNFDVWLLSSTTLNDSDATNGYTNAQTFITAQNTAGIWKKITVTITTPANTMSGFIRIDNNGYNSGGTGSNRVCWNSLMLVEGELEIPWSPHPSEIYEGITSIDKDGIVVTSSNVKSKTTMSSNGFKITKTDTSEDIFSVNSDGTLNIKGNINGGSINLNNNFKVDYNGDVITAGNVSLGGTVTATNLSLNGGLINLGTNKFVVDSSGNVTTAGNVTLGGTVTASNLTISGGSIDLGNGAFVVDHNGNVTSTGSFTLSSNATVPSTTLSGSILSGQLDSSITNDISSAKSTSSLLAQGLNKWMVSAYDIAGAGYTNSTIPTFNMLANRNIKFTKEILDSATSSSMNLSDNYIGYAKTNVYLDSDYSFTTSLTTDDAGAIYLNGTLITTTVSCSAKSITFSFKAGWNTVEVLYIEISGGDGFVFSPKFSATSQIKRINAYEVSSVSMSSNLINESKNILDANKTNWGNAYNRVVQWASGAITGSTTINGGFIQTNTITAEKIAIADFTNYVTLKPNVESAGGPNGGTWSCYNITSTSLNHAFFTNKINNVKTGDRFKIIGWIWCATAGQGVTFNIGMRKSDGTYLSGTDVGCKVSSASTYEQFSLEITVPAIPAEFSYMTIKSFLTSDSCPVWLYGIGIYRMANGELIVDGSITTGHINTDGLNASVIKAGTISADIIDANIIVSKVNEATTTITGDKIRTGQISANTGGSYLNLNDGSMLLGSTSGTNYLQWTGSALNIKANSLSIGGTTAATTTNVSDAKTSAISEAVGVKDTRSTNEAPSWYFTNYPKRTVQEFKSLTAIGLTGSDTYGNLETKVPWGDSSGGYPIQTFYGSGNEIFTRKGVSNTAWSAWTRKVNASQSDVFNTLTNNSNTQGVYLENGSLYLNASMIKTGSLLAERIAIYDFTNYAELNPDTLSRWGFVSEVDSAASNNPWFKKSTIARDNQIGSYYKCNGGETLRIKADISTTVYGQSVSGGTTTATARSVGIMIFAKSNTGAMSYLTDESLRVTATSTSTATVVTINGSITLPDTTREFAVYIQIEGYPTFTGTLKVRNVLVTKMANGELIVDGTIKSNHIDTNSIKANHIDTNTITSEHVDINGNGFTFYSSKTFDSDTNTYLYGDTIFSIKNEDGQNSTVTIKPNSFILQGRNSTNDKDVSIILNDNVLTIDASAITTGALDASLITTGTLDATLIDAKSISGDKINTEDFTVINNTTDKSTFTVKGGKVYVSASDFIITPEEFDPNSIENNNSLASELLKEQNRVDEYIRFNNGTIELGQNGGNYKAELTNNALTFYEKNSAVSWITGNTMYITNNRCTDTLEIGPTSGGGYYVWDYQDNGHLNLSWISN